MLAIPGILAHIPRNHRLPQMPILQILVLLATHLVGRHGQQLGQMQQRRLDEIALETVPKPSQRLRIRADMVVPQRRTAAHLDDLGHAVAHLDHGFLLARHVEFLHDAVDGGHEGVVASPQVPVRNGGLAASVADLMLELVEEIAGAAGQGGDDFEARGCEFGGYQGEEEQREEQKQAHVGGYKYMYGVAIGRVRGEKEN